MRRAGFWLRGAALAIDAVVVGLLCLVGGLAVYFAVAQGGGGGDLAQYLLEVNVAAIVVAYSALEVWPGRTPGKMLLGMVIARPGGAPADRWTLLLRWSTKWFPYVVRLISVVTLYPALLEQLAGFMSMVILVGCLQALDEDKRAWHDEWSGTAVFRRPRQSAEPAPAPLSVPAPA